MKYTFLTLTTGIFLFSMSMGYAQKGKTNIAKKNTVKVASGEAFSKGEDGLEYRFIHKGSEGNTAQIGDFVEVVVTQKVGDSLIYSTEAANSGQPTTLQVPQPQVKGDLIQGLLMMRTGDSAIFRASLDSLVARTQQPRPDWAPENAKITWAVKMVSIKSKAQTEAEHQAKAKIQAETDERLIKEMLQRKGITDAQRTPSGLYYVMHNEGTGAHPAAGQQVTVNYTGVNYEGVTFDSNVDPAFNHVQPFTFGLGQRQVIAGWDEGIALMKKGGKATLYIPSALAYGANARGQYIPANAILIFDVELVDFE